MNESNSRPLTVGKKLGYSIGAFGDSVGFNIFYFFFLFFLTDVAGIPPAIAGTITLVAVAWDAITDPIVGYLSDNLKSNAGRRRPFMITSAIPYAICMFLLFTNVDFSPGVKIAYFVGVAMLFWTFYTGYVIPYFALGAEMTQDFHGRTQLRVWASVAIQLSVMLASAVPPLIVDKAIQTGGTETDGWRSVGILFAVVIFAAIFICWRATKGTELPADQAKIDKQERTNIFKTLFQIFKLKPSLPLAASVFCWSFTTAMASNGPMYIMSNNLGFEPAKMSTFFVLNTLIGIAWLPVINYLSKVLGKKKAYVITLILGGFLMAAFGIVGITGFATILIWAALFQCGNSSFWTLYYSMMYDISEVDEFVNGHRREGIVTALMAFCQKIGAAVGTWVTGMVLAWGAYDGMLDVQPQSALDAIMYICTYIPGLVGVLAGIFGILYPVTGDRFEALSKALEAKRAGREYTTEGFEKLI